MSDLHEQRVHGHRGEARVNVVEWRGVVNNQRDIRGISETLDGVDAAPELLARPVRRDVRGHNEERRHSMVQELRGTSPKLLHRSKSYIDIP